MPAPQPPIGPPTADDASGRPDKAEPRPPQKPTGPPTEAEAPGNSAEAVAARARPPSGPPTEAEAPGNSAEAVVARARPPSGPPTAADASAALPPRPTTEAPGAPQKPGDPPLEREAPGRSPDARAAGARPPSGPPTEAKAAGRAGRAERGPDAPPSGPPTEAKAPSRGGGGGEGPADAPPGDPPTGGSRIRGGVVTRVGLSSGAGGLEGLMAFPPVSRGGGPQPPAPEPEPEGPPQPPALPLTLADAQLAPDQRMGAGGVPRERIRERPVDRIDFRYQRYERLRVTEAVYRCPVRPDKEVDGVRADWPAFAAGRIALGNGYVARLAEATFGDGAALAESARSLSAVGPSLKPGHLGRVLDTGAAVMGPILDALRARLAAGGAVADGGVGAAWLEGRRARAGRAHLVQDGQHHLLVVTVDGSPPDPLLEGATEADAASQRWGLDASQRSRRGQWGVLRRRLALALPWQPREAGMGLHRALKVQQAWTDDPDLEALAAAAAAMRAWLEAHRSPTPETHLARAATFGAESWSNLDPMDARGRLRAEAPPDIKAPPVVWRPPAEVSLETARVWATLVAGCQALGIRPWTYLDAALHAGLHGELGDGSGWTPAAWRARR